jgi:hypothetical protein
MKTLLCSTAISTLLLTGALAQEAQEVENPEQYVEPGEELPVQLDEVQEDELDEVDSADKLNKVILETTTEDGVPEDMDDTSDKDMETDAEGNLQQTSPDASTTPDMPEMEEQAEYGPAMEAQDTKPSDTGNRSMTDSDQDAMLEGDVTTTADAEMDDADDMDMDNMDMDADMQDMDEPELANVDPDVQPVATDFGGEIYGYQLIDADIYGMDGDEVADLIDVIVDENGAATDAIIESGGFAGLGEKTYVVAFTELTPVRDGDNLRFEMNTDKEAIEALAPWSREDFVIGENGNTLLSELRDAEIQLASSYETVEVEDLIVTSEGRLEQVVVGYDDQRFALDYSDIQVAEGDADTDVGYSIMVTPDNFSTMTPYEGAMAVPLTRRLQDGANGTVRSLRGDDRDYDMDAESGEAVYDEVDSDLDMDNEADEMNELGAATGGALMETENEVEEAGNDIERGMEATEAEAEELGNDVERETEQLGNDIERGTENAVDATEAEARETAAEAEMLGNELEAETEEFGNDLDRETNELGNDIERGAEATEAEAREFGNDVERETEELGNDIEVEAEETEEEVESELEETGDEMEEETDELADEDDEPRN